MPTLSNPKRYPKDVMWNLPLILCSDTQSQSPLRNQWFQVSQTTPKPKNPSNSGNPHSCLVSLSGLSAPGGGCLRRLPLLFRKLSQSQLHASSQFFKGCHLSPNPQCWLLDCDLQLDYISKHNLYVQEDSLYLYFDTLTYIWHTHQETFPGLFEHDLFNMPKLFLFPMWGYFSVSSINLC